MSSQEVCAGTSMKYQCSSIFLAYQASAHSNSDLFSILKNGNLLTQLILMFLFSVPLTLNQAQLNTMYT